MPRKKEKYSFENDDRPSRFLIDLKPNPLHFIEQPKNKKDSMFSLPSKEKEIEYSEPLRGKPEPIKQEKIKKIKKPVEDLVIFSLFRIVNNFCYNIVNFFVSLPKRLYNYFVFPTRHHFKKRRNLHVATPGSRALMNSSYETITQEINKFTKKRALAFAVLLLVFVLPLKSLTYVKSLYDFRGRVLGVSEDAAEELKGAAKQAANLNFEQATKDFSTASNKFMNAKDEISGISNFLAVLGAIIPNKDIKLATNASLILDAGRISSDIGSNLSMAFSTLEPGKEKNIKTIVDSFYLYTTRSAELSKELEEKVSKIEVKYLPVEYQAQFTELQNKSSLITKSLEEMVELLDNMKVFLGFEYDKRYLLVFQNNTELRASGGFIGSYALIDFRNGEIKNLEVPEGGSYDTEAGLKRQIIAPYPLQMLNPMWHFWDSNWWPDWPTTARKLMWFYEKSDGPSVDGVISFTPTVLERILQIIGQVDMTEKHGVVLTADNFWIETQKITEAKPIIATSSKEIATSTEVIEPENNKPKKIIGDLMGEIIKELPNRLNKNMFIDLAGVVEDSLNEKHVLFYFTDSSLEQKTIDYGWDGSMKKTAFDYLMVVNTNVAGGKTDRVIRETVNHKAEVAWDGSVIDTVTIKREHTGEKEQEFTGVRNNDWLRVYVPLGSELIRAEGFSTLDNAYFEEPGDGWEKDSDLANTEGKAITDLRSGTKIYEENGKTVFANWSQINPGQTASITLRYRLPFKLQKQVKEDTIMNKIGAMLNSGQKELVPYALLVQKQLGSIGTNFYTNLSLNPNFKTQWFYKDSNLNSSKGWEYNDVLKTDKFWATLLEVSEVVQGY